MIDLGVLAGDSCSKAYYVNSPGQVVGTSENQTLCNIPTGEHAFLWESGGPMVDLNTLVLPGSDLFLIGAANINDRGEIAGLGVLPNGDTRAVLLVPASAEEIATAANAVDVSQATAATPHVLIRNSENSVSGAHNRLLNTLRQRTGQP